MWEGEAALLENNCLLASTVLCHSQRQPHTDFPAELTIIRAKCLIAGDCRHQGGVRPGCNG